MAKSLRSKSRRKCRAIKRERYGVKELERLKKTLGIPVGNDAAMKEQILEDLAAISVSADTVKKPKEKKISMKVINADEDSEMEEDIVVKKDGEAEPRVYNSKTLQDQYGQYPIWLHPRKIAQKKKHCKPPKKGRVTKNKGKRATQKKKK